MNNVIEKTFGGMSKQAYLRHLAFCSLFLIMPVYISLGSEQSLRFDQVAFFVINTLLYPYSRFVYESIMHFVLGKNVFIVNVLAMLLVKLFTMLFCWAFAIFIAPIGLAYLYYLNTRENG